MHAGDYVWLYDTLAATPDDGLAELKARYRHKVRELHPDRQAARDDARAEQLVALNAAFDELLEFHRRTGRLPGEKPIRTAALAQPAGMPHAAVGHTIRDDRGTRQHTTRGLWLAVGLALIGMLAVVTGQFEPAAPTLSLPAASGAARANAATDYAPRFLARGLNREAVRQLEGEPFLDNGARFEYGPSYVEFRGDKVTGWYSSPMQPLHVRPGEEHR